MPDEQPVINTTLDGSVFIPPSSVFPAVEEKLPQRFEIVRSADEPEFVVTRSRHFEKPLVTRRRLKEPPPWA